MGLLAAAVQLNTITNWVAIYREKVSVNLQLNTIRPCYREKYLQLRKCTETVSSDALRLQFTLRKLFFNPIFPEIPKVIFVFSWLSGATV